MSRKSHAEDWLMVLLWGTEKLMFPTLRNLTQSYEGREYERRLRFQFRRLEQRQLVKRDKRAGQIVYRLTELGRLAALGGRDPEARWKRPWDGQWRLVLFDLPVTRQTARQKLLRWLRENGFGYLQHSVWVHPDPLTRLVEAINEFRDDVEFFTVMQAQCCRGYSNQAIVNGAWDFPEINKRYEAYLKIAAADIRDALQRETRHAPLAQWLRQERLSWSHAVSLDPLLPRALHLPGYLGEKAWHARRAAFAALTNRLATIR